MTSTRNSKPRTETIRFRHFTDADQTFIGEATIDCYHGSNNVDEYGCADSDEVTVTLTTVFDEENGQEIYPYSQGFPYALQSDLERAALDHFYNPSASIIMLPGEEESYFDGLVSLGKMEMNF